jgi:hypothetical protein
MRPLRCSRPSSEPWREAGPGFVGPCTIEHVALVHLLDHPTLSVSDALMDGVSSTCWSALTDRRGSDSDIDEHPTLSSRRADRPVATGRDTRLPSDCRSTLTASTVAAELALVHSHRASGRSRVPAGIRMRSSRLPTWRRSPAPSRRRGGRDGPPPPDARAGLCRAWLVHRAGGRRRPPARSRRRRATWLRWVDTTTDEPAASAALVGTAARPAFCAPRAHNPLWTLAGERLPDGPTRVTGPEE